MNMCDMDCSAACNNSMTDAECYSEMSKKYAECLLEFIYQEYSDYLYYKMLCEKSSNCANKRILNCISQDELRHCNDFLSAYFLITGKRFCPAKGCRSYNETDKSFAQILRECYFGELCESQQYAEYANSVDDNCLKDLLLQTSEEEKEHAMMIMDMISKMCACS